jgi:hypothetical protein
MSRVKLLREGKMKPVKAWGGFVDGRLNWHLADTGLGGWGVTYRQMPAMFRTRREARKEYQDVRRVKITEVK